MTRTITASLAALLTGISLTAFSAPAAAGNQAHPHLILIDDDDDDDDDRRRVIRRHVQRDYSYSYCSDDGRHWRCKSWHLGDDDDDDDRPWRGKRWYRDGDDDDDD